jgi:uncharacterized protein YjbI with pentapeptide repeats
VTVPIATAALVAIAALITTLITYIAGQDAFKSSVKTAKLAERGLVTERFKNGVDELGSSDDNVRSGGIYTLAQVANESSSPADSKAAFRIISLFVRTNLCHNKTLPAGPLIGPPPSVVTGLLVLHENGQTIDLHGLRGCADSDLAYVDLANANLTDAHLPGVTLEGATLTGANLTCASLDGANMTNRARLTNAVLTAAVISNAGFEDAIGLTADQLQAAYWNPHPHPTPKVNEHLPTVDSAYKDLIHRGPSEAAVAAQKKCVT